MTKAMIKAIRLVNGFNPDLRVELTNINKDVLYDWISSNYYGIFGTSDIKPSWDSPEWDRYEKKIWGAVRQVINGKSDE